MITGLDHVAIAVRDWDAGIRHYTKLLGIAGAQSTVAGQRAALFALSNTQILLLEAADDAVGSLGLGVADVQAAALQLEAAGIAGDALPDLQGWQLRSAHTHGLKLQLVPQQARSHRPAANSFAADTVEALDHVVIRSAAPEQAVALYGGALGIRLALDRQLAGTRMLFFRTAGVTLELIQDPAAGAVDSFYGVAYRVRDLAAAHARLTAAGFALTEPRAGRKAGTQVFSVRSSTSRVPTLFIRDPSRATASPNG